VQSLLGAEGRARLCGTGGIALVTYIPRDAMIQHRVGTMLARHLAAVNILGRTQVVREVKRKSGRVVQIASSSRFRHRVHFDESNDSVTAGFALDLPADGAADYIRSLTPVTRETFDGLTSQYQALAFTLSGTADQRLIQKVRDALAETIANGATQADFEKAANALTAEAGVADINAFTLDTAFQTAMQNAYSLGRYEQMTDPTVQAVLPFWQYWTVGDDRVRPEHQVLQLFTARADDPVWMKVYPPNGFNCRCAVVPILASEAPKDASEPGLARLPVLARLLVPQPGFAKVFAA
jgi:SPP1 gp7 family putative phage head morphogenesis protein